MSEINIQKLNAAIAEKGLNRAKTAEAMGISQNSLCRKINGKSEFTLSEVIGLCSLLRIKEPCEIFLPSMSQICNKKQEAKAQ